MRHFFFSSLAVSLFTFSILAFPGAGWCSPDVGVESNQSSEQDRERSGSIKRSRDNRDSKGSRSQNSRSTGTDKQVQDALRKVRQAMQSSSADVQMSLEAVFLNKILELEETTEPFKSCRVMSNPRLPASFGLSSEIEPGAIDTIKSQYLQQYATSSGKVSDVIDEKEILQYRDCLALYGAFIGTAYLNLTGAVEQLKSDSGTIGHDDILKLAAEALDKAVAKGVTGTKGIKALHERILKAQGPCYFDNSVTNIKCGISSLVLGGKPQLYAGSIPVYGAGFSGFTGTYRVSRAWSYSDAIEALKSTSTYSKVAKDISTYTEKLESEGKAYEAALVKKTLIKKASSGKKSLNISGLLPSLQ